MSNRVITRPFVIGVIAILVVVAITLTSCSNTTPAPAASNPASPATKPAGSSAVGPAPGEKWPEAISVGSPTSGGGAYFTATALSTLIKEHLNVTASPQVQGGIIGALNAMALGRMDMAYVTALEAVQAYQGKGLFQGKAIPQARVLFGGPISIILMVVRADSPIKSISDLKGKRVMYKSPGNPIPSQAFEGLLQVYNMKPSDVVGLEWTIDKQVADGLTAHTIDAGILMGPFVGQSPVILEASQSTPLHIIDVPEDKLQWVADHSFPQGVMRVVTYKGGQYKGTDYDVHMLNIFQYCLTTTSLPNSFAYQLLKAIWDDHLQEYEAKYPNNKLHSAKNTLTIASLPFHDGTIQYFKEKGLWTPEKQQLQDKLLAQAGKK